MSTAMINSYVDVTKRFTFAYGHRLHNPNMSDSWNEVMFGKCNNKNGHGHNAVLEVTVRGKVNKDTGMVVNFVDLKKIVDTFVIDLFDHKNLDLDLKEFYQGEMSTCENTIRIIWNILDNSFNQSKTFVLQSLRLSETDSSWATITRDMIKEEF